MSIRIEEEYESKIRDIAESSGRSVTEVLNVVLSLGLNSFAGPPDDISHEVWKPRLMEFLDAINNLPVESPDDGFSGADHDEVLYPRVPESS